MLTCHLSPAWCNIGADSPKDPAVERASLPPTDETPIRSRQCLARAKEPTSYATHTTRRREEGRSEEERRTRIRKTHGDRERQKEEEIKKTYFSVGRERKKTSDWSVTNVLSLSPPLPLSLYVSLSFSTIGRRSMCTIKRQPTHTSRTPPYLPQLPDRLPCRGLQTGQRPQKRRYRLFNQLGHQLQRHAHTPKSLQSSRRRRASMNKKGDARA